VSGDLLWLAGTSTRRSWFKSPTGKKLLRDLWSLAAHRDYIVSCNRYIDRILSMGRGGGEVWRVKSLQLHVLGYLRAIP